MDAGNVRSLVILAAATLLLAIGVDADRTTENDKTSSIACPHGCSLVALLSTPERYDGKIVRTIGVATVGFERDSLYLSYDDAREGIGSNAVSLSFDNAGLSKDTLASFEMKRVLVEGVFRVLPGGWGGEISEVSRIYLWNGCDVR